MNYLYNGIEAPELPKSTLPYAYIETGIFGIAKPTLRFTDEKILATKIDETKTYCWIKAGTQYERYTIVDGKWEYSSSGTHEESANEEADGYVVLAVIPKWADYDIFYKDGTLYLAASDPVPVGSAPDIEPRSFMAVLRMGQIVRAMMA